MFQGKKLAAMAGIWWLISQGLTLPAHAGDFVKITDTLTIHYEEAGNGEIPIIFIPTWTMSTKVYARQLAHFADSDRFRAITYDPRGHGLTTKTIEGHYYEQHGRDLKAFIDKLGLEGVILAGWSYGILDELAYLNQFGSDNLRAMILIDGTPKSIGADNTKEWVWYRHDDADGFREFFSMGPLRDRQGFNLEFAKWMLEDPSPANLAWVLEITNQTSDSAAALLNEAGAFLNFEDDLKNLEGKMPLLYVVREDWQDIVTSWAQQHTPSAEVAAMGKHLMFWERHEEFNAVLDRFLQKIE